MNIVDIPQAVIESVPQSRSISVPERLTHILNQLQLSSEAIVFISAFLIGGGTGIAAIVFHWLIDIAENLSYDNLMGRLSVWGHWTLIFVPMLGGLIVGLMRWRYPELLGGGLTSLIDNTREANIPFLRLPLKMLAASVSLGMGASLGPEGPSVEIGANIGLLLGRSFQVSQSRYLLLLGAGAAAGIAAGFNAPIAGVFFALEVVLGTTFNTPAISLILLSAVFSAVIAHLFWQIHPAFDLPNYEVLSNWEWLFYLGLGFLASLVSLLYTQSIKLLQAFFQGNILGFQWLQRLPVFSRPLLGGLCIGLVALQIPQIIGTGYGSLRLILEGKEFSTAFLCCLLVVKLLMTAISLGSGFVGGVFAPALFLGACLGAIYGNILGAIVPIEWFPVAPPAAYAMVGMAAVLAASVRAPLTATLLMFELTGNYSIILPLMAAVGVSVWIVEQVKAKQVVKGLNLPQMGVNLERPITTSVLETIKVADWMEEDYFSLPESLTLWEAGDQMLQAKQQTALVLDKDDRLLGIISLTDLQRHILSVNTNGNERRRSEVLAEKLAEICTQEVLFACKSESVAKALERMSARGLHLLPVVEEENSTQTNSTQTIEQNSDHRCILGIITKNRIDLATEMAATANALSLDFEKIS
jgi:H+/Cl- antiporter ClcA/CBS domain-containing protein